jgi:hypothetical protein
MKINVIWGCPASGKSTYVVEQMGKNDIRFDFDLLMRTLSNYDAHQKNDNLIGYVLAIRQLIIDKLKTESKLDAAWIIVTWVDDAFKALFKDFDDVKYKVMDTTEAECIKRVNENDDRQASKDEQIRLIRDWFKKYKLLKDEQRKRLVALSML